MFWSHHFLFFLIFTDVENIILIDWVSS